MSYNGVWSERCYSAKTKLNFTEIALESLMFECPMREICKKYETKMPENSVLDPNLVMNIRHKMLKQSSKILPYSQVQIHTDALKLLRLETQSKVMRQREEKIIEKEVAKLKEILENQRLTTNTEIDEISNKKAKLSSCPSKLPGRFIKLQERLKSCGKTEEVGRRLHPSVHMMMTSKTCRKETFLDVKEDTEESLESLSTRKGSVIDYNTENEENFLENERKEDKNEIMMRYFRETEYTPNDLKQEGDMLSDFNEKLIIKKMPETQSIIKQKRVEHLRTWKPYAQQLKRRKGEEAIHKSKIEAFLTKLQEGKINQEKTRPLKNVKNFTLEIKKNIRLENRVKIKEKQTINEKKEGALKNIMQEVIASQAVAKQKLREIKERNVKNREKFFCVKFLQKMEKRRQERLTRRKEIQEKKLKLEEEKEKAKREKEEKEKQNEEKQKREKLEELKEKRRLEKEKKLEQKRQMEILRLNMKLAEDHYGKYLVRGYGWRPWTTLLKIRHSQFEHAVAFHENKLTQKVFLRWMAHVREQAGLKVAKAVHHQERTLKKNYLLIWMAYLEEKKKQYQVAQDWHDFKITEGAFKTWLQFTQDEQLKYLNETETAERFYYRKLKINYLKKLQNYPKLKKLEQAMEIRKRIWRQKVKEILPDYEPVNDFQDF